MREVLLYSSKVTTFCLVLKYSDIVNLIILVAKKNIVNQNRNVGYTGITAFGAALHKMFYMENVLRGQMGKN